MKSIIISIILCCSLSSFINAQSFSVFLSRLENEPENFSDIFNEFNQFVDANFPNRIPQEMLSEYKAVIRYYRIWKSRLGILDGKLSQEPYLRYSRDRLQSPSCSGVDAANWECIGPFSYPTQFLGLVPR